MARINTLLPKDKYSIAVGFMLCMTLVVGFAYMDYHSRLRTVAETRASGLSRLDGAVFGGVYRRVAVQSMPRRVVTANLVAADSYADGSGEDQDKANNVDRKIVRKGSLSILANDADAASRSIQKMAKDLGGYVVNAQRNNADTGGAVFALSLRVPANRLDEAWGGIHQASIKVEAETMDASDVTKQYIDLEAGLRNLRAEESQYLLIMKQARTVKDTLDVSEHLSEVRGKIEKTQGEFQFLQHDIEMSEINVQIRSQVSERVMGIQWRPLYQSKVAFRDSVQALADYFDSMVAFILYLPVIIMWGLTIFGVGLLGFHTLRYVWRRTLGRNQTLPIQA